MVSKSVKSVTPHSKEENSRKFMGTNLESSKALRRVLANHSSSHTHAQAYSYDVKA